MATLNNRKDVYAFYTLYNGNETFGVTYQVYNALEGLMLWKLIEKNSIEVRDTVIHNVDCYTKECERLFIPEWVMNKALQLVEERTGHKAVTMEELYKCFEKGKAMKDNETVKHTLYCGKLRYDVTPASKSALEGLIYWTHVLKLERAEKEPNEYAIKEADLSIKDMMNECEALGVPNWVGNGAIQYGETHDLRSVYIHDFFTKSQYSEKAHKERMNKERE